MILDKFCWHLSLTLCLYFIIDIDGTYFIKADDRKSASDLVRSRGFNVDEFSIVSQNYILKLYRIINPLADPKKLHKIPVLACHGISWDITNMMSASKNSRPRKPKLDERVTLYAMENGTDDRGLHFYLSNNNYDVWLLEARGVSDRVMKRLYESKSIHNEKNFWDFSLDEQALIDLPLQIDFVLKKTGAPKLAYIAYSQSTTLMFALLSIRLEYSEKLACFIALAPVVFTTHLKGAIWPVVLSRLTLHQSSSIPNVPIWLKKIQNFILTYLCSISTIRQSLCSMLWGGFAGPAKNSVLEGGVVDDVIKSTSLKSFEQYMLNSFSDDFRMFDYKDEMRNMEEYGQPIPPQYNISKINLKTIVLFRGTSDYLSDPQDQQILLSRLRVPLYEDHILEDYAHIDFVASETITRDINEPILRVLDKLTGRTVTKVSHTLGTPNPQVEGTKLVMDVQEDLDSVKSSIRSNIVAANDGPQPSLAKEERANNGGVVSNQDVTTIRKQLFGKDSAAIAFEKKEG